MRFGQPKGPEWIVIIDPIAGDKEAPRGVRIKSAHIGRRIKRMAARASQKALTGIDLSDRERELSDVELDQLYDAGEVSSREMIRLAILEQDKPEWDGVLDAKGKPLAVTPENVVLVLADEDFFEAADRRLVWPVAQRDREKNGFAPSPSGTGGASIAAGPTAKTARKSAPRAPTRSTPSKAKPGKASGKS